MDIKILRTHADAKIPQVSHKGDMCFDLYSVEEVTFKPGETRKIDVGFKMVLPDGYGLRLHERSGMATKGFVVGAGVIDEGYRGPMCAVLRWFPNEGTANLENQEYILPAGHRIAQGRLVKLNEVSFVEVNEDEFCGKTERAEAGFGSTGK